MPLNRRLALRACYCSWTVKCSRRVMSTTEKDCYFGPVEHDGKSTPRLHRLWNPSKEIKFAAAPQTATRDPPEQINRRAIKHTSISRELYQYGSHGASSKRDIPNWRPPSRSPPIKKGKNPIENDCKPQQHASAQPSASRRRFERPQEAVKLFSDIANDVGPVIFEDAVSEEGVPVPYTAVKRQSESVGSQDIVRVQTQLRFVIQKLFFRMMRRIYATGHRDWLSTSQSIHEAVRLAANWRTRLKMLLFHSGTGLLEMSSSMYIYRHGSYERQYISMYLFRFLSAEQQYRLQRQMTLYAPHTSRLGNRGYASWVRSGLLAGSSNTKSTLPVVPKAARRLYHDMTDHTLLGSESTDSCLDADALLAENSAGAVQNSPIQSLSFQIPKAKLKEAMMASRESKAAYWQYSLYENPAGAKVKVHYCKSKETTERTAQLFLEEEVIGFDIEWKPQASADEGVKKNISLIQLASEERIALFHIARYPKGATLDDFVAPTLKRIMESPSISKVGVAVKADCTRLRKFMGIESRGLFELSHLHTLIMFSTGNLKKVTKKLVSLAQQVEEHLQLPLFKGEVRSSDWSQDLNYEQITYAASDTYAGLQLYKVMEAKRLALPSQPPRPYHAELDLPICLGDGHTLPTSDEEDTFEKATSDQPLAETRVEELTEGLLSIEIEDKSTFPESSIPQPISTRNKRIEVITADAWVLSFRNTHPHDPDATSRTRATPAHLRAYSLWHHQEITVENATCLLRERPLKMATVCGYILEAIRLEKLPYDAGRLRVVLEMLGQHSRVGRYQALWKRVG